MYKFIANLINNNYIFRRWPVFKKAFKFALVGLIVTCFDFLIYISLTRSFDFWQQNYLWANLVSFSVAIILSYYLNRTWTFRNKNPQIKKQFIRFIITACIGFSINELVLFILVAYIGLFDLSAKFIALVIAFVWNFNINHLWAFKANPEAVLEMEE